MPAELPSTTLHLLNDLVVAAIEGWRAAKHDIKDDSNAPHVAFLRVVAQQYFRCDVIWCAIHCVHAALLSPVMMGRAEVNQLD